RLRRSAGKFSRRGDQLFHQLPRSQVMVLPDNARHAVAAEKFSLGVLVLVKAIREQDDQIARFDLHAKRAIAGLLFFHAQRQHGWRQPFNSALLAMKMQQRALPGGLVADAVMGGIKQAQERRHEPLAAQVLAELAVDLREYFVQLRAKSHADA